MTFVENLSIKYPHHNVFLDLSLAVIISVVCHILIIGKPEKAHSVNNTIQNTLNMVRV